MKFVIAVLALAIAGCAVDPAVKPWWTLNEASFAQIKPRATSKDEVRSLVGRAMLETKFPNLREEVWDYRYLDVSRRFMIEIHFDDNGVVTYTSSYPDPAVYATPLSIDR